MMQTNDNKYQDIALTKTKEGYFDISFDEQGDFLKTKGLDTAMLMTVFERRRADVSEIAIPEQRGGWYGNDLLNIPDFEIGSKNWLLNQTRADQANLNFSKSWNLEATQWFVDDNLTEFVDVNSTYNEYKELNIEVIFVEDVKTVTNSFNLANNTRNVKF